MSGEHDKEREAAIETAAKAGWTVARITKRGYAIMHCGCGIHTETLKKTPRNPDHFRQKANKMVADCSTG